MNYTVPNTCLQSILDLSSDIFIVVEMDNLKLLDWNPAFNNMGFGNIAPGAEIFLAREPHAAHFAGIREIIDTQSHLLRTGHEPSSFESLSIGKQDKNHLNSSAKVIYIFEDKNAVLIQISMHEDVGLSSKAALQKRDILLTATSKAAQELLNDSDDFDATINKVLGLLGNATNVDRVYVWSIHKAPNPAEDDRLYTSQLYEWSGGADPQQGNDIVTNLLVSESIASWIDIFQQGKCVNNLVKNMPQLERDILEPQGIISILTAPIMFHGHLWGFVGFDNCHSEYTWSHAEEDILRTAGTLISTAIYSRHTNQALYEAQERFRGVEEATGDIIWSVDENQNINYISPHLVDVLQYDPSEIVGKPFNALLLNPTEFKFTATPEKFIIRDFEFRVRCKDDSIKWLRSSCKYTFDKEGKLLYGFGSSSDVTYVHEAQSALHVANQELEEAIKIANALAESANKANEIKSNFLANMSHEIRTPMNAVVGITHLLKHTELTSKQTEYIEQINDSSAALLSIINDILDFSMTKDGHLTIEKYSFAIGNVVNDIKATAIEWIGDKNLNFTVNVSPEVAPSYIGDELRLNQILTSLVTNAVKFTNAGGIHIDVHVESENKETVLLHLSVQDTGIGIPQEEIDMLFQDFTQADITSTRRYGGIGLGLALCKNLIILMGGDIWCTSTMGKGSTFNFTCRLEKEVQAKSDIAKPLKDIHILAAFPNNQAVEALQGILLPLGYNHLDFAYDAMSITKYANSSDAPDVILLHQDFSEATIIKSVLRDNATYFNNIPIIYYAPNPPLNAPEGFAIINSLQPSILHDAFVTNLNVSVDLNKELFEQGFENFLRLEHRGKKILLVEDNEINQMIAQSILEEVGFEVTVANDGSEGVDFMYKDDFDLVIMDIQMPKMDGLSATKIIREEARFAHIPIIALTAHAMEEDREKSLNAGMNDHTTKPIDTTQLFKKLLYWLSRK